MNNVVDVRRLLGEPGGRAALEHDADGLRPLHTAVKEEHGKNSVLVTQMLLRAGADAMAETSEAQGVAQPLHLAAAAGFEQACLALLQYKADVNARQKDDQRPLHLAVARGHESVVEALLRVEGVDIEAADAIKALGDRQALGKIVVTIED